MADSCGRSLKVCADRITLLSADGSPLVGAASRYTADDLVTLTVKSEYGDDEDFEVVGASGLTCGRWFRFGPFKRLGFDMERCSIAPQFQAMLASGVHLTSGAAHGFAWPEIGSGAGCAGDVLNGVAYEAWTLNVNANGEVNPTYPYLWWLFPKTVWKLGDKEFKNDFMPHSFSGAGEENGQWLDGAGDNWPVASDRAGQWIETATLPTAACGASTIAVT